MDILFDLILSDIKLYCEITLICLITSISQIEQHLLIRKFYCFRLGPYISFKYVRYNDLRCPMIGEVSHKRSLIKHMCS